MTEHQRAQLEEIVHRIQQAASAVVEEPAAVTIALHETASVVTLLISTAVDDVGRVVGRGGSRIDTLRSWARQRGARAGLLVHVDVAGSHRRGFVGTP